MLLIILEGADRVGKTTAANRILGQMRDMGMNPVYDHCNKDSRKWHDVNDVFSLFVDNDSVVCDRLYDSEYVYSLVARGSRSLSPADMLALRDRQSGLGVFTVFVHASEDDIRKRYESSADDEHYVSAENSIMAQGEYMKLYNVIRPVRFRTVDGSVGVSDNFVASLVEELERGNKNEWLMSMAWHAAARTSCAAGRAGCVLADDDGVVLSVGYNGMATHGTELHCVSEPCGAFGLDCRAVHAEVNAIDHYLHSGGDAARVAKVYVTCSPCVGCAEAIVDRLPKVKTVYYDHLHHRREKAMAGIGYLMGARIGVSPCYVGDPNKWHRIPVT